MPVRVTSRTSSYEPLVVYVTGTEPFAPVEGERLGVPPEPVAGAPKGGAVTTTGEGAGTGTEGDGGAPATGEGVTFL